MRTNHETHTDGNDEGAHMDTGLPYGSASIIEHENTQRQHKNVIPLWYHELKDWGVGR